MGDPDTVTTYEQWVTEKINRPGAKGRFYNVQITTKKQIDITVLKLVELLNTIFLKHVYVMSHQFETMSNCKLNLKKNDVYIVIEFSENYVLKFSNEIQCAHFGASKKQASLQTGAFYYKNHEDELQCVSFASISDSLRHDACAVWALLQPIFVLLRKTVQHCSFSVRRP